MGDWSTEQLADSFLRFVQQHSDRIYPYNGDAWRASTDPHFDLADEKRAREFLLGRGCISYHTASFIHSIPIEPPGYRALQFPGGPLAYWEHEEEIDRLRVAALRKSATDSPAVQARPNRLTRWDYVERTLKILAIPGIILASVGVYHLASPAGEQGQPSDSIVDPPAIDTPFVHGTQPRPLIAPIGTTPTPPDSTGVDTARKDSTTR